MTAEKLIDLVFTEMVYCKMQQLEEAEQIKHHQVNGNRWTRFRKTVEVLDDEERWINYTERALSVLNHDLMWQGIVEGCKILKYPEPSETHREPIFFSTEIFFVSKRLPRNPLVYKLKDYDGEKLKRTFYDKELQKVVKNDDMYKIENILKKRRQ